MEKRVCSICGVERELSHYRPDLKGRGWKRHQCRACRSEQRKRRNRMEKMRASVEYQQASPFESLVLEFGKKRALEKEQLRLRKLRNAQRKVENRRKRGRAA